MSGPKVEAYDLGFRYYALAFFAALAVAVAVNAAGSESGLYSSDAVVVLVGVVLGSVGWLVAWHFVSRWGVAREQRKVDANYNAIISSFYEKRAQS